MVLRRQIELAIKPGHPRQGNDAPTILRRSGDLHLQVGPEKTTRALLNGFHPGNRVILREYAEIRY
jgi:hypothetical protein